MSGRLTGSRVGRYRLEAHLGSGGMGSVYRAHDTVLERDVAIKLVSRGAQAGPEAQARLLREGQALARLDHPHVVRIFDVGRSEHGLFVAMELVDGRTLATWAAEERPPWRAIVRAYVQAGRGLMAGHRLDIVHRDFKPANVMLDRQGRARVLDFGLARLLDRTPETPSDETETAPASAMDLLSTCLTRDGEVVGTPIYMAPEQHHAREITQASDQFSFCASLYEALAGTQPFRRSSMVEVARAKASGPPEIPTSTTVPRAVWVAVRRGLHPDPDERWPSMDVLIEALEAEIRGSRRYAAVLAVIGTGVVTAALLATPEPGPRCRDVRVLDPIWNDARHADLQRGFESAAPSFGKHAWSATAEHVQAWSEGWTAAHQRACEDAAEPDSSLDATEVAHELDARMACLREQADALDATLEALEDPKRTTVARAGSTIATLPTPTECLDPSLRAPPSASTAEAEPIRALVRRAYASYHAGRPDRSRAAAEQAVAEARELGEPMPLVEALLQRGIGARIAGKRDEAIADYTEAYFLASEHDDAEWAAKAAARLVYMYAGRDEEELARWTGHTRASIERAPGLAWLETSLHQAAGNHAKRMGDLPSALAAYREALGSLRGVPADQQDAASLRGAVANVLTELGRYDEAIDIAREAVAHAEVLGEHHPSVISTSGALGIALWYRGDNDEAVEVLTRTATIGAAIYGTEHPRVQLVLDNRAGALIDAGQAETALKHYDEAIPKLERAPDEHASRLARILGERGRALGRLGRFSDEVQTHRRAVAIRREALPERHPRIALSLTNLGAAQRRVGDVSSSIEHLREAVDVFSTAVGESTTRTIVARSELARSLAASGDTAGAIEQIERATTAAKTAELDPVDRVGLDLAELDVWIAAGRTEDAEQRATTIRDRIAELGQSAAHLAKELETILPD